MKKRGFTLVEILAVITIIGLLGLLTIPMISNSVESSKMKAYRETINFIVDAAKVYRADNDYADFTNLAIDVTGSTLQYENKSQIISGQVKFEDDLYLILEIKSTEYCAVGTSKNFRVYKGECVAEEE